MSVIIANGANLNLQDNEVSITHHRYFTHSSQGVSALHWAAASGSLDAVKLLVEKGANVQDGSVLHAPPGIPVDVGPGATIAHMCTIHGVHVGMEALIANHCTVLDGAVIGARSLIAAHSLVVGGTQIPPDVLVTGAPGKVKGPLAGTRAEAWVQANPQAYRDLGQRYLKGLKEVRTEA